MGPAVLEDEPAQLAILAVSVRQRAPRALRTHLPAFAFFLILGFMFTLPGSLSPGKALLGYPIDNFQHAWFLWHFAKAVAQAQNPFYTNLLFYPHRVNLAWSTTDPLGGALALPLSLTVGPAVAYNLSIILQLALTAFFARLLCLRISRNEMPALLGGFIFGFSPFFLAHALGHLSLVTAFPIPLFAFLLDKILSERNPSWRLGFPLGIALLLAALAHYNYAVICVLFGALWFAGDFAHHFSRRLEFVRRTWKPICVGAATFLIGFSPVLWMLIGHAADMPVSRGSEHVEQYSADVLGFLVPSWNHVVLGRYVQHWNLALFVAGFEGTVYIGIVVLALAALGYWKGRLIHRSWAKRAVFLGTIFYLISLGPKIRFLGDALNLPGPAALLYRSPIVKFVSAPARFHVAVALCVAILASLGVKVLLEKFPGRAQQRCLLAVISILLLADYLTIPFPRSSTADPAAPEVSSWSSAPIGEDCVLPKAVQHGTILTFPLVKAPYVAKSMWMQAFDNGRYALVDGYLSYTPEYLWSSFWGTPVLRSLLALQGGGGARVDAASDRASAASAISDLNLSAVVVFDSPERDTGVEYVQRAFGAHGQREGSCTVFPISVPWQQRAKSAY